MPQQHSAGKSHPRSSRLQALCAVALTFFVLLPPAKAASSPTGLVVYGGTASGVMTAYAAAREGVHVVLLEPGSHLGGMVTGGLSATDLGHFQIIGGYARDFYRQAATHYGVHSLDKPDDWLSEPHVDEAIFASLLKDAGVEVHFHERLREKGGVAKSGTRVSEIVTEDGRHWRGAIFADCSYEGDLMAQAGISYTVGREATAVYGEDLAGVRVDTPKHQFTWPVSAYDDQHKLLPLIDADPLEANGTGDRKVQAYNFRLIVTSDPANRLPWTRPDGYDPSQFALLARYLKDFQAHQGRAPVLHDVMGPHAIPNHKADVNNNGPFSTDFIGKSWDYPDAGYADRARIWQDHLRYTQAFFWFLSQDSQVPASLQAEVNSWGRAKDEFIDTDHWPNQLYVREGRRMVGEYIMKQSDLQTARAKADSIGMGSYNSDSHNVQRLTTPDGDVRNEGDVQVPVQPYEIPYRVMLPKRDQADNLLVPVCLSASHVAYSSVRMEPQYMIIGQAAGTAAALAIKSKTTVQDIDIATLQRHLRDNSAILHLEQQVLPLQPPER